MSISSRISSMEEHVTNAYNELQGLGADLTGIDKNIENISMVLDDIYDSMPQVSGEGTSLTLDDTRVGKIKSALKGNTSQSGTPTPSSPIPINVVSGDNEINVCGKNLLENQYLPIPSADNTATYEVKNAYLSQGTYTLATTDNSTFGNTVYIKLFKEDKQVVKESGHLSTSNGNYSTNTYNYFIGTANNLTYIQFTIDDNYYARIGLLNSNNTKEVMLVKGTEIVRTYEPYSSNSYPINLGAENLFDKTKDITTGKFYTSTGDIGNDDGLFIQTYYIPVYPNASYSFKASSNDYFRMCEYNSSKTFIQRQISANGNTKEITYTTTNNTRYIRISCGTNNLTSIELTKGTTPQTISPNPIELAEISTYNDEIFRTSGKNLFDNTYNDLGMWVTNIGDTTTFAQGSQYLGAYCKVEPGTYTISRNKKTNRFRIGVSPNQPTDTTSSCYVVASNDDASSITINVPQGNNYICVYLSNNSETSTNVDLMIEKGSTATEYNPYGTGEWYYKEAIKKIVLDGTETISAFDATSLSGSYQATFGITARATTTDKVAISDKFISALLSDRTTKTNIIYSYNDGYLRIATNVANTMAGFKTWLETNTPKILLEAETPTYIKITSSNYPTLYSQLEAIYNAQGYDNQTNISQINNDLPFIISASALKEWSV